jgi:hypothetical protein
MRKLVVLLELFFSLAILNNSFAQETAFAWAEVVSSSLPGRVTNDPKDTLNNVSLLRNKSIRDHIDLMKDQAKDLNGLLISARGSLAVFTTVQASSKRAPPKRDPEYKNKVTDELARRRRLVSEILSPVQMDRLVQACFRLEAHRLGLGNAILNGFLGDELKVAPDQLLGLRIAFEAIEKDQSREFQMQLKIASDEFVNLLPEEQQILAVKLFGKGFSFIDTPFLMNKLGSVTLGKHMSSLPSPSNRKMLSCLLINPSVAREIGLDIDQLEKLRFYSDFPTRGSFNSSQLMELSGMCEQMLSDKEIARLEQMLYQIEVSRMGFERALRFGHLKKADLVVINDELLKSVRRIDRDYFSRCDELRARYERRYLDELPRLQRDHAIALLGASFPIIEEPFESIHAMDGRDFEQEPLIPSSP